MKSFKIVISLLALGCFSMPSFAGPLLLGQDTATDTWKTVLFDSQLLNPVVFTSLPVNADSSDQITQVRNVTNTGFDVRMLNPYGNIIPETSFDYLAVEAGLHFLGDTVFEAGTTNITTEADTLGASANVTFSSPSLEGQEPGVITSTQTVNDTTDAFMVTRTRNIDNTGLEVHLQTLSGPSATTPIREETVGWLSFIDKAGGSVTVGGAENNELDELRWLGVSHPYTNHETIEASYASFYYEDYCDQCSKSDPFLSEEELRTAVFGQIGFVGSDLAWLSESPADPEYYGQHFFFVDEDAFNDSETSHTYERLSVLGFGIPVANTSEPAPVPEPASVWLLLLGVLGLSRRRSGDANSLIAL